VSKLAILKSVNAIAMPDVTFSLAANHTPLKTTNGLNFFPSAARSGAEISFCDAQ